MEQENACLQAFDSQNLWDQTYTHVMWSLHLWGQIKLNFEIIKVNEYFQYNQNIPLEQNQPNISTF